MKSIKPGRGPSKMNALSGIFVALFGVFWTGIVIYFGAWFMAPFGLIFIAIAVINVIYNYKNATGEERYSEYDIVDESEEGDPLNRRYGGNNKDIFDTGEAYSGEKSNYCPYCGKRIKSEYEYCPYCGRRTK